MIFANVTLQSNLATEDDLNSMNSVIHSLSSNISGDVLSAIQNDLSTLSSKVDAIKPNEDCIPKTWLNETIPADMTLSGTWTLTNYSGSTSTQTTNLNIETEFGYTATWKGAWKWMASSSQTAPVSCSGSFGEQLPSNDVFSDYKTFTASSSKTISQTMAIENSGLEVKNNQVVKASGTSTKSVSASVSFKYRYYFGFSDSNDPAQVVIKSFDKTGLITSRSLSFSNVTAASSQYTVLSYPKSLGDLTSVIQDGVTPVLGAFSKTADMQMTTNSGSKMTYIVYVSNNKGAFTNASLTFK